LPGYRVGERLGHGGFAVVWEVWQDERPLALKVGRSPTYAERLDREGEALALVGPPWVPRLERTGRLADQSPFLLMERLRGVSLAGRLETLHTPPDRSFVRGIAMRVLRALQAIGEHGLVHGDLKPENLFLDPDTERVTILDFGLHERLAEGVKQGTHAGTPEYMAPEQLGAPFAVDTRTDLYAFGLILYELLTLRLPFVGDRATIERGHLAWCPPPPSWHAQVAAELDEIVLSCLQKRPPRRPADAARLIAALENARWVPEARARGAPVATHVEPSTVPCVLVAARPCPPLPVLQRAARRHAATLAHQQGDLAVFAVEAGGAASPLDRGSALARALAAENQAQAVVHIARAVVRRRPNEAPRFSGDAILDPHSWLPRKAAHGVTYTDAAASAFPTEGLEGPLVGREEELGQALSAFRAFVHEGKSVLFLLLGEPGVGKTHLLGEIARRLVELAPQTILVRIHDLRADPGALFPRLAAPAPMILLVDNTHLATDGLLDLLEDATQPETTAPVFVLAAALPVLDRRRPRFGAEAHTQHRVVLPPLGDEAAVGLLEHQLLPAEFTPRPILLRLARYASGIPSHLVELAHRLRRAGLLRIRPGDRGAFLDTAGLDTLPPSPVSYFQASETLQALPSELVTCVEVCAVLGSPWSNEELAHVLAELAEPTLPWVDPDVGLEELAREDITRDLGEGQHAFSHALFEEGVESSLLPAFRERVHRHALAYWQSQATSTHQAEHVAKHAQAVGDHAQAAQAHGLLAREAEQARQYSIADAHYAALLTLESDERARLLAEAGRGRILYRIDRMDEALVHLGTARAMAQRLGDRALETELLLEEATALDWAEDYTASAEKAHQAGALLGTESRPALRARWRLAVGRSHWRKEEVSAAVKELTAAASQADAVGDDETRTIALLLVAPALVQAGRLAEAEARFAEVVALTESLGDALHLCAAHANRMVLWMATGSTDSAIADLRAAIALARELGHSQSEQFATSNLAELLYWAGEDPEALRLTERAQALHARAAGQPIADLALLRARIHATQASFDDVKADLAWIDDHIPPRNLAPSAQVLCDTLRLLSSERAEHDPQAWQTLIVRARTEVPAEVQLEVMYFRALAALRNHEPGAAERMRRDSLPLLASRPIWAARWARLGA
jgi:tetratricopeptide (TPR) repeat protein